jgi:hypothetical protein
MLLRATQSGINRRLNYNAASGPAKPLAIDICGATIRLFLSLVKLKLETSCDDESSEVSGTF